MILVDRGPAPPELDGHDSPGAKELAAAIRFFEKKQGEEPSFEAYKDKNVRELLQERFRSKCAYCESRVAHVAPEDIEHYRPKSAVKLGDGTKVGGYWWLAMAWENLLLSCIKCNRLNKEEVVGEVNPRTVGKGNWFPLCDETVRALRRGEEANEEPLLIDPCGVDPSLHLRCGNPDEDVGEEVLVGVDDRGQRSIEIYGLNRKSLVDERHKQLLELRFSIKDLDFSIRQLEKLGEIDDIPETMLSDLEANIAHKLQRLKQALDAEEQYLLLSRQVVLPYLAKFGIDE